MTACSTLLSLAMLPLNTMMYVKLAYGREVSLAWTTLALSLLNTVTAISLGLLACVVLVASVSAETFLQVGVCTCVCACVRVCVRVSVCMCVCLSRRIGG